MRVAGSNGFDALPSRAPESCYLSGSNSIRVWDSPLVRIGRAVQSRFTRKNWHDPSLSRLMVWGVE